MVTSVRSAPEWTRRRDRGRSGGEHPAVEDGGMIRAPDELHAAVAVVQAASAGFREAGPVVEEGRARGGRLQARLRIGRQPHHDLEGTDSVRWGRRRRQSETDERHRSRRHRPGFQARVEVLRVVTSTATDDSAAGARPVGVTRHRTRDRRGGADPAPRARRRQDQQGGPPSAVGLHMIKYTAVPATWLAGRSAGLSPGWPAAAGARATTQRPTGPTPRTASRLSRRWTAPSRSRCRRRSDRVPGSAQSTAATATKRLRMIDMVRAKLRIIQRRCSAYRPRRTVTYPVTVQVSHNDAITMLLTWSTGPNGVVAPSTRPTTPAGRAPPNTYTRPISPVRGPVPPSEPRPDLEEAGHHGHAAQQDVRDQEGIVPLPRALHPGLGAIEGEVRREREGEERDDQEAERGDPRSPPPSLCVRHTQNVARTQSV